MMGSFWNAFTKNAALFRCRKVSLTECPHIPRERIDGIIAKYELFDSSASEHAMSGTNAGY